MADRLGRRPLVNEPLTVEDWQEVYVLYRGFQDSMKRIALRAKRREREATEEAEAEPRVSDEEPTAEDREWARRVVRERAEEAGAK